MLVVQACVLVDNLIVVVLKLRPPSLLYNLLVFASVLLLVFLSALLALLLVSLKRPPCPSPTSLAQPAMASEDVDAVRRLIAERDGIEASLRAAEEALATYPNVGMHSPLIDAEGFPRADIDVHQVRVLRNRIHRKQASKRARVVGRDASERGRAGQGRGPAARQAKRTGRGTGDRTGGGTGEEGRQRERSSHRRPCGPSRVALALALAPGPRPCPRPWPLALAPGPRPGPWPSPWPLALALAPSPFAPNAHPRRLGRKQT